MSRPTVHAWVTAICVALLSAGTVSAQCTISFADYLFQGPLNGQQETDLVQYHSEGYGQCFNYSPTWCSQPIGVKRRGTFHKSYWMSQQSGAWLKTSTCVPYVHNMKTSDGKVVEYGCADVADDASELIWEVLPGTGPRIFWRWEGGTLKRGMRWGNLACQSASSLNASVRPVSNYSLREDSYQCTLPGTPIYSGTSSPKGRYLFIGPILLTASAVPSLAADMRRLKLVPATMPDADVIPSAWYTTMPQTAGHSGDPVYLVIREDDLDLYCGSGSCKNLVETYWYLAINPGTSGGFGLGLVRWNIRSEVAGVFYGEVVMDTLKVETPNHLTAVPLCY